MSHLTKELCGHEVVSSPMIILHIRSMSSFVIFLALGFTWGTFYHLGFVVSFLGYILLCVSAILCVTMVMNVFLVLCVTWLVTTLVESFCTWLDNQRLTWRQVWFGELLHAPEHRPTICDHFKYGPIYGEHYKPANLNKPLSSFQTDSSPSYAGDE